MRSPLETALLVYCNKESDPKLLDIAMKFNYTIEEFMIPQNNLSHWSLKDCLKFVDAATAWRLLLSSIIEEDYFFPLAGNGNFEHFEAVTLPYRTVIKDSCFITSLGGSDKTLLCVLLHSTVLGSSLEEEKSLQSIFDKLITSSDQIKQKK